MAAVVQTQFWLNSKAILDKIDEDHRRAFLRFGAFIRTVARRSMRRTKNPQLKSDPGGPPYARRGQVRDLLLFAYDANRKELVVGPKLFQPPKPLMKASTTVPNALEQGGTAVALPPGFTLTKKQGRGKSAKVQEKTFIAPGTSIPIAPRPFMQPALNIAIREDKLKRYWEAIA